MMSQSLYFSHRIMEISKIHLISLPQFSQYSGAKGTLWTEPRFAGPRQGAPDNVNLSLNKKFAGGSKNPLEAPDSM